MKHLILIFLFIQTNNLEAQVITDSFLIENHYRTFHFNKTAKRESASLIFILHGSGGTGLRMMQEAAKLELWAENRNYILVYPNGYKKFWNECRKASTAEANKIDINEQAFFIKMMEYFTTNYGTSPEKNFVIGFSGGGHMAFKLAQTIPEKIFGICTIVANLPDTSNNDCIIIKKPISVMLVNGTADSVSPYNGGKMNTAGVSLGTVQSVQKTFEYWGKANNTYTKNPIRPMREYFDTTSHTSTRTKIYEKPLKPSTVSITIHNGKHEFPKFFDVFDAAWNFFKSEMERRKTKVLHKNDRNH
jgi:polyhydroxybutyrate depolymerase